MATKTSVDRPLPGEPIVHWSISRTGFRRRCWDLRSVCCRVRGIGMSRISNYHCVSQLSRNGTHTLSRVDRRKMPEQIYDELQR
eukprot:6160978-Pleurochrysis_carterae.AAC.2